MSEKNMNKISTSYKENISQATPCVTIQNPTIPN